MRTADIDFPCRIFLQVFQIKSVHFTEAVQSAFRFVHVDVFTESRLMGPQNVGQKQRLFVLLGNERPHVDRKFGDSKIIDVFHLVAEDIALTVTKVTQISSQAFVAGFKCIFEFCFCGVVRKIGKAVIMSSARIPDFRTQKFVRGVGAIVIAPMQEFSKSVDRLGKVSQGWGKPIGIGIHQVSVSSVSWTRLNRAFEGAATKVVDGKVTVGGIRGEGSE